MECNNSQTNQKQFLVYKETRQLMRKNHTTHYEATVISNQGKNFLKNFSMHKLREKTEHSQLKSCDDKLS